MVSKLDDKSEYEEVEKLFTQAYERSREVLGKEAIGT